MLGRRRLLLLPLFAVLVAASLAALAVSSQPVAPDRGPASVGTGIRTSLVDAVLPSHHVGDRPTTHRAADAALPASHGAPDRPAALLPELRAPVLPVAPLPLAAPRAPPALG
ncbi:MAG TPA: hypothetical protein VID47_16315 [Actinomycetota bacterium]|jgi:hypothetical protein